MLLPMSLAQPKRGMVVCRRLYDRVGCRCVLGYAIGALLYDSLGHWLITLYGLTDKVETFRASYANGAR